MTEAKVSVGDRRVRFVGVETYKAEGGGILRDLFTEDGGGWLEDVVLLDRLVGEKLSGLADEAREREGWKWAEPALDYPDVSAFGRVYPVAVERSEADAAEITALSEEYDRIVSEAGAEGLSPEEDARQGDRSDRALAASNGGQGHGLTLQVWVCEAGAKRTIALAVARANTSQAAGGATGSGAT